MSSSKFIASSLISELNNSGVSSSLNSKFSKPLLFSVIPFSVLVLRLVFSESLSILSIVCSTLPSDTMLDVSLVTLSVLSLFNSSFFNSSLILRAFAPSVIIELFGLEKANDCGELGLENSDSLDFYFVFYAPYLSQI